MCGIAGAVGATHEAAREAVLRASAQQAHRGPDADGFWASDPAGPGLVLAHRRLSILDLSEAGRQPMEDPESGICLCFNGEIYNYRELRGELEGRGRHFRTGTDTEVILQAFATWGVQSIERLRGMFAFALWDPAHRRTLLARDRLGIKPLYLARVPIGEARQVMLFASELRALLATGRVSARLDPGSVARYLWNGFVPGPTTILRDVRSLDPGTWLLLDEAGGTIQERRYWSPGAAAAATTRDPASFSACLSEASRQHLASDVPLGVFLSGGIDSSAVAALAAQESGARLQTFTVALEESDLDESSHARAVAAALGTDHHEIRLTQETFVGMLPEALASLDQPTFDAINTHCVSRAVREAGITVALAGTGGDELFGGYRSFVDIPRAARAARWLGLVPEGALRRAASLASRGLVRHAGDVPPQTRWGKLGDVLATRGRLVELYQVSYALFTQELLNELVASTPDPASSYGLPPTRARLLEAWVQDEPVLNAISLLELSSFLGERLLRDTDAASMAVALEVRVPLLDHEVVEQALSLDARRRFRPLGRKQVLRDVALAQLDPRLFDRPKSGFVLPFDIWCREELRPAMHARFEDAALCEAVGLRPEAIGRLWRAWSANAPGLYWSRVWAPYVLLHWAAEHRASL